MQTHIQKWGNSLGLRIPMQLAKELQLHQGSPVTIEIDDHRIVIQVPKYNLDSMVKEITAKNQHHVHLDDVQTGREEW